jgi:hypothetical protein
MTAMEVLKGMGLFNPSNNQCKECGAVLRELLGPPSRVKGRDKWRVPIAGEDHFSPSPWVKPTIGPAPEDRF